MDASDSAIVVVGGFTHYDGTEQPYIARIITTGREGTLPIILANTVEQSKNTSSLQAQTQEAALLQNEKALVQNTVRIQAFPNPFSEQTQLRVVFPNRQFVRLAVYDALGCLVANIVERHLEAGEYSFTLNATQLPSNGVYHYRAETEAGVQSGVLAFIR
jgi:hypothetical protein